MNINTRQALLSILATGAIIFTAFYCWPARAGQLSKKETVCESTADCRRVLAQQIDTCPTNSKLSVSFFKEGVAEVTCIPVVPQMPPPEMGDMHRPNITVKPVTSASGGYWVMGTNCSREPTLRLARTTVTGRTVYEAYCLAADERLNGASVINGAKRWPAHHSSLGCIEVDTANGRTVENWPSDVRGARLDHSTLVTFNAEVTVVSCGARKIFAKKKTSGKKNFRAHAARH